jgi:hypothetical protein
MQVYHPSATPDYQALLTRCNSNPPVLYARDTIDEFHSLLVGTLITYSVLLQKMFSNMEHHKQESEAEKKGMQMCKRVWRIVRLGRNISMTYAIMELLSLFWPDCFPAL